MIKLRCKRRLAAQKKLRTTNAGTCYFNCLVLTRQRGAGQAATRVPLKTRDIGRVSQLRPGAKEATNDRFWPAVAGRLVTACGRADFFLRLRKIPSGSTSEVDLCLNAFDSARPPNEVMLASTPDWEIVHGAPGCRSRTRPPIISIEPGASD